MADQILPFPMPYQGDPDPNRMALATTWLSVASRNVAPGRAMPAASAAAALNAPWLGGA
jgi:hypothetical protein